MLNRSILIIFLFFTIFNQAGAQTGTGVKGIIKTQKGEPLPFAAIVVKGTDISTISNEEGKYQLDLKPGYYEVIFSIWVLKPVRSLLPLKIKWKLLI